MPFPMRFCPKIATLTSRRIGWLILTCLVGFRPAFGASNVDAQNAWAWAANFGWINARPDSEFGAELRENICTGYLYSANAGWIHLGDGTPENGVRYQNDSSTDFGVNLDSMGNLRGLAYGANIGWITFHETGMPRVDLSTGQLSGSAYAANAGWIRLSGEGFGLRITRLSPGTDTDGDGLPDSWERTYAQSLSVLSRLTDTDGDGTSDLMEYLADTNPLEASDSLRITQFESSVSQSIVSWAAKPTRSYSVQSRSDFGGTSSWIDVATVGLGGGPFIRVVLPNAPGESHRFFRVQAIRPLSQ